MGLAQKPISEKVFAETRMANKPVFSDLMA